MANRAYKFRMYPNDKQKILFAKTFGCVRMVYNHWLDRKIRQYEENKINVTYTICAKEMAAMKKTEEYRFVININSIEETEKRNSPISQMRLRSVFKMRMSILSTAITEQMGYGIISFFVCFF